MTVKLRDDHNGRDVRSLWVELTDEGALRLIGQDLGPSVEALFGAGKTEYEWEQLVHVGQLPKLLELLGIPADADIVATLAEKFSGPASYDLERTIREHELGELMFARIGD